MQSKNPVADLGIDNGPGIDFLDISNLISHDNSALPKGALFVPLKANKAFSTNRKRTIFKVGFVRRAFNDYDIFFRRENLAPHQAERSHLYVSVRDNNVDQALKALKKKMQREGIWREMKRRRSYEKPSEVRARKKAEAVSRARKLERKRLQVEGF
jgi:small subunit ribosomal protein S21